MGGFDDIAKALGKKKSGEAISFFEQMLRRLEILPPRNISDDDLEILTNSVNIQRLKNNPVRLDKDTIRELYRRIPEVQ